MKKNALKYLILLLPLSLVTKSCEKKLNQVNPNQQTSTTFWQNASDAVSGMNAGMLL